MKKYGMFLQGGKDIVHPTQQTSIEEATKYFAEIKKMTPNSQNNLEKNFKNLFYIIKKR